MRELDCEESWAPKNWCFWTVVLKKTLESPLDCKEIQPVHSKGDQPRVFFGSNDAKAETPVLWPPHAKSWLIGKDPDAGRDWGQKKRGTTEEEMAGWHHQLNGREFEWTPGDGDGQGGLACCDSWGHKESDTIEQLNWTELMFTKHDYSEMFGGRNSLSHSTWNVMSHKVPQKVRMRQRRTKVEVLELCLSPHRPATALQTSSTSAMDRLDHLSSELINWAERINLGPQEH